MSSLRSFRSVAHSAVCAALLWLVASALLTACTSSASQHEAIVVEYQRADDPQAFKQFLPGAVAAGRVPVAHFYADWCGPCRRFKAALAEPQVDEALQRATLMEINIDSCQELAAYYSVTAVPSFIKLDAQGRPLAKITSDKWGEDTPDAIAPVMRELVQGRAYDGEK